MFTIEIAGRPVAVTDANEEEPRKLLEGEEFRADLLRLETDGGPLWNGRSALTVRAATEDEIAEFEQVDDDEDEDDEEGDEDAEEEEEDEDAEVAVIVFLVPIVDPDEPDDA